MITDVEHIQALNAPNGSADDDLDIGPGTGEPPSDRSGTDIEAPEKQSILEANWVRLSEHPELLTTEPPKIDWLLTREYKGRTIGVFPRGRTGLLSGTGGVSKTFALVQLSLAVATGGFWLDTFRVTAPGHVLLAVAEEDLDEVRRRLWRAANLLELSLDQRRDVAERIDILPLHGQPVALTHSPHAGVVSETAMAAELKRLLDARGVDWSAIIIDPLSRWAGGGVEADNEAATRFVQVIERIGAVPGRPGVLVAHHSSKLAAKDGTSDARGVTGIRDGFRWHATMDAVTDETTGVRGVKLRNRKSNYSLEFDDILLVRSEEPGTEGTLVLARDEALDALDAGDPVKRARARDAERQSVNLDQVARDASTLAQVLKQHPDGLGEVALRAAIKLAGHGMGVTRLGAAKLALAGGHDGYKLVTTNLGNKGVSHKLVPVSGESPP